MTSFCPNKSGLICAMLVLAGAGEIVYARESTVPSPAIMGALTSASKAFKGTPMADISESIETYYAEMASAKNKNLIILQERQTVGRLTNLNRGERER